MCWTLADSMALSDYINLSLAIACRGCQGLLEKKDGMAKAVGRASLDGVLLPVVGFREKRRHSREVGTAIHGSLSGQSNRIFKRPSRTTTRGI